ncbi:MAG: methyltransferase domain-containing protein [Nanoarchaeota archaeon]|nr:methyltransferase domain-containing protein [Nanoarchaeota archaeon]MBU1322249.1 methyltransferase domain-containing protein [Nanoarchaeota archaeon]MBU1598229.1 methyltransferase domain-containing protein [Nanoarchaeota archaeon]MBU2441982.1 methyltransferase domain-containing protein [Nanoarchaeota archaeon]
MAKKKILIKKEKKIQVDDKERVISGFEKHYVDADKDFHTKHGIISKKDLLKKAGSVVKVKNHEFIILDPVFLDHYKRIKRMAQIITLKDIGAIIANTGITKDSVVLDAGSGSGAIACFLAMLAKKVISYDIDKSSLETTTENIQSLGLRNITVKEGNIYSYTKINEKNIDIFVLDVPDPGKAIKTAQKVLKIGGFLVIYLPNITQVQDFVKELPEELLIEKTIEVIEREWAVDAKRSRPKTKDHGHTAFLTFVRKLK